MPKNTIETARAAPSLASHKPRMSRADRHRRFKQAAGEVFVELGYDGTTIREIARRADCNLGVFSLNWRNKQDLFAEVLRDRLCTIFERQMAGFHALERGIETGNPPVLADILRCQIVPIFLDDEGDARDGLSRLMFGRGVLDPSPELEKAMGDLFEPSAQKFFELLRRALPGMDPHEFYWRALCVVGSFTFVDTFSDRLARFAVQARVSVRPAEHTDWAAVVDYVIQFVQAGLCAPSRKIGV